jgi:hypothetical protein
MFDWNQSIAEVDWELWLLLLELWMAIWEGGIGV